MTDLQEFLAVLAIFCLRALAMMHVAKDWPDDPR